MISKAPGLSLLEELEARQDEVLDELDRLNGRIEQIIAENAAWGGDVKASPAKLPAAA